MKKCVIYISYVVLSAFLVSIIPIVVYAQIECDKFDLNAEIQGSTLHLSVDTDLPGFTNVTVTVSRSYYTADSSEAYSMEYFSERSTIDQWRSERKIFLDDEKWKDDFREHQARLSRAGVGSDIQSISDFINVRMVVPIRQSDPRFGNRNENLMGSAVRNTDIRVVEGSVDILQPFQGETQKLTTSKPSLDPLNLDVMQKYVLSRETPLMPSPHSSGDIDELMVSIKRAKRIPADWVFMVNRKQEVENTLWYMVSVFGPSGRQAATGWINSGALIGQTLKINNP